jgi:hypothetical protein
MFRELRRPGRQSKSTRIIAGFRFPPFSSTHEMTAITLWRGFEKLIHIARGDDAQRKKRG